MENFCRQLMNIGNGAVIVEQDGKISLPFGNLVSNIHELLARVFPNLNTQFKDHCWLRKRAILVPKNVAVDNHPLEQLPGDRQAYKSINSVLHTNDAVHYPVEFLNSLAPSGLSLHELHLKAGAPVMLLRNLNPPKLCNGTKLIKKLMQTVLEATLLTRKESGEDVFIPKIPLIPSDTQIDFKRLQFPLRLSFAMSNNSVVRHWK
ncbi:uncharacterized protein LOC106880093 [Octopus bimaculoides]|uniref:uncharacterized protein LOC106880093 n=1 Tax=Octopus bimaculoides TaxID=37653 RepID=UPI00071D085B|nr:uncharacterized protein LOC106880093 [Octopus bimaculoides]|eukprot:XP_014785395.1 PREDICTED: uncharacterized protein LOC106880093 [Octopus bimaculoides]